MTKIIEVKNLYKSFKSNEVLEDLSLTIDKGERITIIGANGAGKTTLFKILSGLSKPDKGEVIINGKISMQFQDFDSNMNMYVKDFINISMDISGIKWDEKIKGLYLELGIEQYEKRKMNKISIGEKQRVNFFLSFIEDTDILLVDEFSAGLDLASRLKIREILLSDKKRTIISITHQPEEIEGISDRVVVLEHGNLILDAKVKDINKEYKGDFVKFMSKYIR